MAIMRIRDANGNIQEIVALRGEKGEKGQDGTVSFDELTDEQKASLKVDSTVLHVTVTGVQASHTPAEIKSFVDDGGIAILGDGYFLTGVDEQFAYFLKSTVDYGNSVTMREFTVFENGEAVQFTQTYLIPNPDNYVLLQDFYSTIDIINARLTAIEQQLDPGEETSVVFADDGNGNVTVSINGDEAVFTDDGNGNVTLVTDESGEVVFADDGNGNIILGVG